jgi:hypothetical protein
MKVLTSVLAVVFFLTIVVFTQAQDKQTVKKETKVEKVEKKSACCTTEKAEAKAVKESCGTKDKASEDMCCADDEAQAKSEDCCKVEKSKSTKSKESKN